jgi:hypothetical protein
VEFSDRAISKKEDRKGSGSDLDVAPGKAVVPQGSFSFLAGASFPLWQTKLCAAAAPDSTFQWPLAKGVAHSLRHLISQGKYQRFKLFPTLCWSKDS